MNVDEFERLVLEFYSCTANGRRQELHDQLLAARKQSFIWQLSLQALSERSSPILHLFAAQCLTEKIASSCLEYTSTADDVEQLRQVLFAVVESSEYSEATKSQLILALASFMLHTMPDIWEDPLGDCIARWHPAADTLLYRVLAEVASRQSVLRTSIERRINVRSSLMAGGKRVATTITESLQQAQQTGVHGCCAMLRCLSAWLGMSNSVLDDWTECLLSCLQLAAQPECVQEVSNLLTELSEHEQLSGQRTLIANVFTIVHNLLVPQIDNAIEQGLYDDDPVQSAITAICALIEQQSYAVLKLMLANNTHVWECVACLLRVFSLEQYPCRQQWNVLCVNAWTAIEVEAVHQQEHSLPALTQLYTSLLTHSVRLCVIDELVLDADQLDTVLAARESVQGVLVSCHNMLGASCVQSLMQMLSHAAAGPNAAHFEAVLFALQTEADELTADEPVIEQLLCSQLHSTVNCVRLCILEYIKCMVSSLSECNSRVACSALRLVDSLTHIVLSSDHAADYMAVVLPLCLSFVSHTQTDVCKHATIALKHLMDDSSQMLIKPYSEQIVHVCHECFSNEVVQRADRLRALHCCGYALAVTHRTLLMQSLNHILTPRVQHIERLCQALSSDGTDTDTADKHLYIDGMLFELDVLCTLIGSVQVTSPHVNGEEPVAVLLLRECVPLLHAVHKAAPRSALVADKLCACMRQCLVQVQSKVWPFLNDLLTLIDQVLLIAPSVFDVCKQLFIHFSLDGSCSEQLVVSLQHWTSCVAALCSEQAAQDNVLTGVFEGYWSLCVHLPRKHWSWLSAPSALPCVHDLLALAIPTLNIFTHAHITKAVCATLTGLVDKAVANNMQPALALITAHAPKLVPVLYTRLLLSESSCDGVSDVLYVLNKAFPSALRQWLGDQHLQTNSLLQPMLALINNKRKFTEMARRINMEHRRLQLQAQ